MRSSALSAMCMRGVMLTLCALTPALHGCGSAAGLTHELPPAPLTPGAMVTDEWFYHIGKDTVPVPGTWVHLPAAEAGELLLWIDAAERR